MVIGTEEEQHMLPREEGEEENDEMTVPQENLFLLQSMSTCKQKLIGSCQLFGILYLIYYYMYII